MAQAGTTLRWIGIGPAPASAGIQSTTVNPDARVASEGAQEWLVTNGLGGYASGTMTGLVTRRFHGYLIAALPSPHGRTMMLNHMHEMLGTNGSAARLSEQPDPENTGLPLATLREFRLELGIPVWTYEYEGNVVEKRLMMPHRQNTVLVSYQRIAGSGPLALTIEPWCTFGRIKAPSLACWKASTPCVR